jgi:archaellum biogenesis protein FlaJ (TadC family)
MVELTKRKKENLDKLKEEILSQIKSKEDYLTLEISYAKQQKKANLLSNELRAITSRIKGTRIDESEQIKLNAYVITTNPLWEKTKNLVEFWAPVVYSLEERLIGLINLRRLSLDLYACGMRFRAEDYISFVTSIALTLAFVETILLSTMYIISPFNPLILILGPIITFFAIFALGLKYPSMKNKARAANIEQNLLFALREMSTLLSAGMGISGTIKRIADADYEELSKEFKVLLTEINYGIPTEDAIKHMIERNYSQGIYRFGTLVIRTLKSGGELNKTIRMLADDIAREQFLKIQKYIATLNMLSIFYLFSAAVAPVMFGILNSIQNLGLLNIAQNAVTGMGKITPITPPSPTMLILMYYIAFPMILIVIYLMVQAMEPKGFM